MNILFPDERSHLSRESGIRITTLSSSCNGPRFIWPLKAGVSENMKIRPYQEADRVAVIALWEEAGLALHLNDARKDIDRKVDFDSDLFLIGEIDGEVVATVMAGSDGHGGWVNKLAVGPSCQRKGCGRLLMEAAEHLLVKRGWPKMNLQVRNKSAEVIKFYCSIGYADAQAIHLGKRLIHDQRIFHKAKQ